MGTKNLGFKKSPNYAPGRRDWEKRADVIVHHVTDGTFESNLDWLMSKTSQASYHFLTGQDGRFLQLVQLKDTAWGNGNSLQTINEAIAPIVIARPTINANLYTYSIGNEGWSFQRNFGIPTAAQREAILEVHKIIVDHILTYNKNWRANRDNVIGHCHIRSKNKPDCPSPNFAEKFPFDDLINEINLYIASKANKEKKEIEVVNKAAIVDTAKLTAQDYSAWPGITLNKGKDGYQVPFVLSIAPVIQATMDRKILNSVRIAQAIIESNWGTNTLARKGHNLFSIRADVRWHGPTYNTTNDKWSPSKGAFGINSDFRAYDFIEESVIDHANFLTANPRYAAIIGKKDYRFVARKIKDAGYSMDPHYAERLVSVIEANSLTWFDSLPALEMEQIIPTIKENLPTDNIIAKGIKVGTVVQIKTGARTYHDVPVTPVVYRGEYVVVSYSGEKVVLDVNGLNTAFHVNDLNIVRNGTEKQKTIEVGAFVKIQQGAVWMTDPEIRVPNWVIASTHRIDELSDKRALLNKDGINSPIDIKYLTLV